MEDNKAFCSCDEFKATIGPEGQLIIETESEECQRVVMLAASEKGIDVKHVIPKKVASS